MATKKDTEADPTPETTPKSTAPASQPPSVGRIVLYTNRGDGKDPYPVVANAAIITRVEPLPLPPEFPPVDAKAAPLDPKSAGVVAATAAPEAPADPLKVSLVVFRAMGNQHIEHGVEFTTAEPGSPDARGKWCWPPRV